ncbi:MAG: hypothetical protein KDB84_08275 [Flavobacteriales bacterium]|nr:hypothetical protein [Flavobacteriales bacterium]
MPVERRSYFIWMALFFIAMAFLESAVVVYLRALYYPDGFGFPLVPMSDALVSAEIGREFATMIMLLVPGALVTRSRLERFAWFCFGFGIWDIFYYVWLEVLLGWPAGPGTADLLFLIPVPWVGPVWAPCLVSLGLIALALVILHGRARMPGLRLGAATWACLVGGAGLIILSFVLDPLQQGFGPKGMVALEVPIGETMLAHEPYVPGPYPWPWFAAGSLLALVGMIRIARRYRT